MPNITIVVDGAAHNNPGVVGYAYVLYLNDKPYRAEAKIYGFGTNNEAEYQGILASLAEVQTVSSNKKLWSTISSIEIKSDSKLAIEQLKGNYRIKEDRLKTYARDINSMIKLIEKPVMLTWTSATQIAHDILESLYEIPALQESEETNASQENNNSR